MTCSNVGYSEFFLLKSENLQYNWFTVFFIFMWSGIGQNLLSWHQKNLLKDECTMVDPSTMHSCKEQVTVNFEENTFSRFGGIHQSETLTWGLLDTMLLTEPSFSSNFSSGYNQFPWRFSSMTGVTGGLFWCALCFQFSFCNQLFLFWVFPEYVGEYIMLL